MSHHHHHCCQNHSKCCQNQSKCCESSKTQESCCEEQSKCSCSCHQSSQNCSKCYSEELLALADEAWTELVKAKIKKQIEAHSGEHLEELAKIVSDANHERWQHILAGKQVRNEYQVELGNFFHTCCNESSSECQIHKGQDNHKCCKKH
jgi:hypothetical protein